MNSPFLIALVLGVAACNTLPPPEPSASGATSPDAPTVAAPYQPVLAGTAAHAPVALKSWKELNDRVAPGAGRSP